jgi:hypothetical protein
MFNIAAGELSIGLPQNNIKEKYKMIMLRRRVGLCILTLIVLTSGTVFASSSATITGRILDQNGASIVGAKVDAKNIDTNLTYSGETNGEGLYVITNIPPGRYRLFIRKDGFQTIVKPGVEAHVQDIISLNFTMQLGSITQSITIQGDAPLTQTESATVGTLVDRQFVGNLPLNGRSFQSLIALTPGTVFTKTNTDEQGQFSVNGQRANANYFTIDGVSANVGVSLTFTPAQASSGSLPGLSATGGTNNLVSIDALQEFKVLTSTYSPEFGRQPGAQVSIVTRSGTNGFHGTAFDYFRNGALDANDWFANRERQPRPALKQNIFGGTISGPIVKNKTFFFFSYEGHRLRLPRVLITDVPSVAARQVAPAGIKPFLNAFPLPNGPDRVFSAPPVIAGRPTGFAVFSSSFVDPSSLDTTSIRADHALTNNMTLFGRYNYSPSEVNQRGANAASLSTIGQARIKTQTLTFGHTWILTPYASNDLRFNYSRNRGIVSFHLDNFGGAVVPDDALLFPSFASRQDSGFIMRISGGINPALVAGASLNNVQRQINLVDNLGLTKGAHQLKFGVDYRRLSPITKPSNYSQSYFVSGVGIPGGPLGPGQALTGRVARATILTQAGPQVPIFNNYSLYGQDSWKVTPRLTLTYGLRWEVNPPPHEANGKEPFILTQVDNPATFTLAPRGTRMYETTFNNFAPRIGVAYSLSNKAGKETVLRGGFGIFYDLGYGTAGTAYLSGAPFSADKILPLAAFPLTPDQLKPPEINPNGLVTLLYAFDPHLKLPYTYQWNFAVEQSLGANQTLTATYVAAVGRRLLRQETLAGTVQGGNLNPAVFAPVSIASITRNEATSDYHALQLQYQRRLSRGFQSLASYTWAKSLDNVSTDSFSGTPAGRLDPQLDRGPSNFDVRHIFTAGLTYNIPALKSGDVGRAILRDWAIDSIISARSATPVNVFINKNIGFGQVALRPDRIQGVQLYINDRQAPGGRRFNPAAFAPPAQLRQGTLARNSLRGFPLKQVDFAIRRQFKLKERLNLQFKAEMFNLFNHPNFDNPDGKLGDDSPPTPFVANPNFGRSVFMLGRGLGVGGAGGGYNPLFQIGGPRSTQLSLKLLF